MTPTEPTERVETAAESGVVAHTPGPWTWTDSSWEYSVIHDAAGNEVAIAPISDEATEETQEVYERAKDANARLIAAAPDLLAALQLVVDTYGFDSSTDSAIWLTANAALAKARGHE